MGADLARPFTARWRGALRALPAVGERRMRGKMRRHVPHSADCPVPGAPQRGCSGPGGAGAPRGSGLGVLPFPALPKLSRVPCRASPVSRRSLPRPEGARGAVRAGRRSGALPQPLFPQTALCPPPSPPGSGEQPSGKFFQGRPRVWFL